MGSFILTSIRPHDIVEGLTTLVAKCLTPVGSFLIAIQIYISLFFVYDYRVSE